MIKFFNLRGTSGAGKTHVERAIFNECSMVPIRMSPNGKKVRLYKGVYNGKPIYILGDYSNDCGGCDTIPSVGEVAEILLTLVDEPKGVVMFSGLMISHMQGTVSAAMKPFGYRFLQAYLDTPLELMLARVQQRRDQRGDTRPFNPENTIKDFKAVQMSRAKAIKDGFAVVDIDHTRSVEYVKEYLNAACK